MDIIGSYSGELQKERPMGAAKVKDELYIFTGTYPMYYKGDGRLYMLPEYKPNFTELVVSSHNMMMADFDDYYYKPLDEITVEASEETQFNNIAFQVKDFEVTPKLPFTNLENANDNILSGKFSFSIPQGLTGSGWSFEPFKVYQRSSVPGAIDSDYQELEKESQWISQIYVDGAYVTNQTLAFPVTDISTLHSEFLIRNISTGFKDFKFEFKITDGNETYTTFVEISQVTVSPEKVEDYPNESNPNRGGFKKGAGWSCNRVIEHYGRLIAWGSLEMPKTLFISNDYLNGISYFPFLYSFTLENDLEEAVNAITPFMNILVIQSDSYTWGLKGSNPLQYLDVDNLEPNPNAYQIFSINKSIGTIAPKSVRPVRNRLYFLSQEGLMELTSLFATDDRYNVKPIDRNIINLIPQDRDAVAIQFDNQYWINFPSTGETFRYYIDKQAWVKDSFGFNTFNGIYRYYNKDGKLHFVTHPMSILEGNNNSEIYEGVVDYSLATDFGQPIISEFLTSKMNQDYPFHWKRYKELKLDFSVQNEYLDFIHPLETSSEDNDVPYTITGNFKANRTYSLGLNIPKDFVLTNVTVTNASDVKFENGLIYFSIGKAPVQTITVNATNATIDMFDEFVIMDATYDSDLAFNLNIIAENNSLIRNVDVADSYYSNVLNLESNELGLMSNTFESNMGDSQLGKSQKFVHTNKLYGNGYDLELYYKDASKVKWTLETIGVAYKMRKARSR